MDRFWEGLGRCWTVRPGPAGEFRCEADWQVRPRVLNDFTFWFVRGGAELHCEDRSYGLTSGDLLLVPPGLLHRATHDPAGQSGR
jgi:mannose-6-phosphate isomerase-like protein (cupin superfamily)